MSIAKEILSEAEQLESRARNLRQMAEQLQPAPSAGTVGVSEAARLLGVSRQTINAWTKSGKIYRNPEGRIPATEIERHLTPVRRAV